MALCNTPQMPLYNKMLSTIFGAPQGKPGREGKTIQGLVVHCIEQTQTQYDNLMCMATPKLMPNHTSLHYVVSPEGMIHQYVDDANIAWGMQQYLGNFPSVAPVTPYPGLATLSAANPGVSADLYTLHIGVSVAAPTAQACDDPCEGQPLGMTLAGYKALVQLLAYLSHAYSIPHDAQHIAFHDAIINLWDLSLRECKCNNVDLVGDVAAYVQGCANPKDLSYNEGTDIAFVYGENACECKVKVDAATLLCAITAEQAPGQLTQVYGTDGNRCLVAEDDQTFVVRNETAFAGVAGAGIAITPGGINGHTPNIAVNPCTLPIAAGTIAQATGKDANGCLVAEDDKAFVVRNETPLAAVAGAGIVITPGGVNGHTPTIAIDPCTLPVTTDDVMQVIGLTNGCLSVEDDRAFTVRNETPWTPVAGPGIAITPSGINGHSPTIAINICTLPIPVSNVDTIVGVESGCLVQEDQRSVVVRNETPLVVVDTATIDFGNGGTNGHTVTGVVKFSGVAGNQASNAGDGVYVPQGANAVTSGPITGNGSPLSSIDIDFSKLDNNDRCDLGSAIPGGVVDTFVGKADNGCLIDENGYDAVQRFETPLVAITTNTVGFNQSNSYPNGHEIQAYVKVAPTVGNLLKEVPGGLTVACADVQACIVDRYVTGFTIAGNQAIITRSDGVVFTQAIPMTLDVNVQNFTISGSTITLTETDGAVHTLTLPQDIKPVSISFNETTGQIVMTLSDGAVLSDNVSLCAWLQSAIVSGSVGVLGATEFLGRDCQWHVLPTPPVADVCATISALPTGAFTFGATQLVTANCQKVTIPDIVLTKVQDVANRATYNPATRTINLPPPISAMLIGSGSVLMPAAYTAAQIGALLNTVHDDTVGTMANAATGEITITKTGNYTLTGSASWTATSVNVWGGFKINAVYAGRYHGISAPGISGQWCGVLPALQLDAGDTVSLFCLSDVAGVTIGSAYLGVTYLEGSA